MRGRVTRGRRRGSRGALQRAAARAREAGRRGRRRCREDRVGRRGPGDGQICSGGGSDPWRTRPGWGPETSVSCDPGNSSVGAAHCDWQKAHFLSPREGRNGRLYARDPDGVLPDGMLTSPYDGDVRMPADAHDTGYRFRDRQLWPVSDPGKACVRTSDGVEAWLLVRAGTACP